MDLFGEGSPKTLADVLGTQAETQNMGLEQAMIKRRKQAVAQLAAKGNLNAGVADYPLTDIASGQLEDLGGVQAGLAESLGNVPAEDWMNSRQNARNEEMLKLMAGMRGKSGGLAGALGGAMSGASAGSALGPWGALAGGIGGGGIGYFS